MIVTIKSRCPSPPDLLMITWFLRLWLMAQAAGTPPPSPSPWGTMPKGNSRSMIACSVSPPNTATA